MIRAHWLATLAMTLIMTLAVPGGTTLAASFEEVAMQVQKDLTLAKQEQQAQKAQIAKQEAELQDRLAGLKAELAGEQKLLAQNQAQLDKAGQRLAQLKQVLADKQGQLDELAGTVRGAARELLAVAERSPVTAEDPGRLEALKVLVDKRRFPGLEDIAKLMDLYLAEMAAGGLMVRRQGQFVDQAGQPASGQILRLGTFTTLFRHNGQVGFLTLGPASGQLLASGGEPSWLVRRNLRAFFDRETPAVYMDIGGGAALRQLARRVSLGQRLLSGGPLIWPILLVGLIALVLIGERMVFLRRVRANTDELMDRVNQLVLAGDFPAARAEAQGQAGRPTSNVLLAGLNLRGQSHEVIENGLAEATLRELPRLERFLTTLKVLAAVAPLLGLLGTVTGMINTFQVITLFGTGDPRLMAGGISEALVTTQLGLAVAIPIMVAAALLTRRVRVVSADMEEKAVALTAALLQRGGQP